MIEGKKYSNTICISGDEPFRVEVNIVPGMVVFVYRGAKSDPDQEPDGAFDFAGMLPEDNQNWRCN